MNVKLLLTLFLFVFQLGVSQTAKPLKGVVYYDNFLLENVDVINKTSKQVVKTNDKGEFVIDAKADDILFFNIKDFYLKRLELTSEQLESNNLEVLMIVKPEELEEVLVTKTNSLKLSNNKWHEQAKNDEILAEKNPYTENKIVMVRGGTFVNGLNFAAIGKKLIGLFSKDKEEEKEASPEIEFATLAKKTCEPIFFTQTLKLKPEVIDLFLQFCDADPKSKKLKGSNNVLAMMDFLTIKNAEFQNIK